ncbi:MAG: glycosyltransferase family 2 protein [Myxococcota bacterium]|nr:glycosyltransferase family 2 protein [Myxococcota bacterium]
MKNSYVVIVGKNVEATIADVVASVPRELGLVVVNDGSEDRTLERIPDEVEVVSHPLSRGYGAAQKSGYRLALDSGADRVCLLHGDGQYHPADVLSLLDALDEADVALGSRFLCADGGRVIPWWRRFANRGLTELANWRWGIDMSDLHTGARAFRAEVLRSFPFESCSDDYLFDQQILGGLAVQGKRFAERAVSTTYEGDIQSISPWNSMRYGVGCLRVIFAARH